MGNGKGDRFRELLKAPELLVLPGGFSPMMAKMVEEIGFDTFFMAGSHTSSYVWGLPDAGLITMREMGLRFAFGTDGSSFNDDNDLWTELRLGWFLARPPSIEWEPISAKEWFTRCIQEGNRIAMHDNLGSLESGKTADIAILEGRHIFDDPASYPDYDAWTLLLHRTQGHRDVHTVLSKGEVVRRDGKNTRLNEKELGLKLARTLESRHQRLRKDKPFFKPILEGIHKYFQEWERETDVPDPKLYRYNRI